MHLYKIVAQISLIISILNLVLASPIGVDETAVAGDVAAMPNEQDGEAASDRSTSTSSPSFQDALGSPQPSQPSSDGGSTFSGYPTPPLSPAQEESVSGYAWLLHRPQRLNLYPPASPASPHLSSSGQSEITLPWWLQGSAPEHPPSPQSTVSSEMPYLSASGGSLSSHYFSASDRLPSSSSSQSIPIPEGLAPSYHLASDGSPPLPPSPPTGALPDSAEFFNKDVVRKLKIVAGMVVVGSVIAGGIARIVSSQIEHRDFQDS